jgi:hypothetical protein
VLSCLWIVLPPLPGLVSGLWQKPCVKVHVAMECHSGIFVQGLVPFIERQVSDVGRLLLTAPSVFRKKIS